MKNLIASLALLALAGCLDGNALHATTPDAGAGPDATEAADLAPAPDLTPDTLFRLRLGQGLCSPGFEQMDYAPVGFIWCEAITDAGGNPCGDGRIIGWYKAGLYKCGGYALDGGAGG